VLAQLVQRLLYRLDGRRVRVLFPAGARDFSLLHNVQAGSGVHPASYTKGTEVKKQGREADHSPLPSADVRNCGGIPPLPHMSSWRDA
jgi:hypothetical protein